LSLTTIPQPTALEHRPTQLVRHPSGYVLRTGPYDEFDPGPWPWRPDNGYRRDLRTGRHRRGEAPDPFTKLREDAWARFLASSEVLAQAHVTRPRRFRLRALGAALRRAVRRITRGSRPAPAPTG
jgi:hypothetical protein